MEKEYDISGYLESSFIPRKLSMIIKRGLPKLKRFKKQHKFDAIAFRGMSGAIVASILAYKLGVPLIAVRQEPSKHDHRMVMGLKSCQRYIIIDDFYEKGTTIKKITNRIKKFAPKAKPVGVFFYDIDYYYLDKTAGLFNITNKKDHINVPILKL